MNEQPVIVQSEAEPGFKPRPLPPESMITTTVLCGVSTFIHKVTEYTLQTVLVIHIFRWRWVLKTKAKLRERTELDADRAGVTLDEVVRENLMS